MGIAEACRITALGLRHSIENDVLEEEESRLQSDNVSATEFDLGYVMRDAETKWMDPFIDTYDIYRI
jgi:hypothetical protein